MENVIDPEWLEKEFYSRKFYMSYSGLNKLLYSPALFYRHYILQKREDKIESYLIDGKLIHCLILDNGSFEEQFVLMPSDLPTGNTRLVIDMLYNRVKEEPGLLKNYTQEIIEILARIKLHQSLKTDEQRLAKIISDQTESYFEFLKLRGDKDLIDDDTLKRCNEAVAALRNNGRVCDLLGLHITPLESIAVLNEKLLFAESEHIFGLKGIVDNITVNYDEKIIHINDLKTTGKTIAEFKDTIEYYNYWSQAAIYVRLVKEAFKDLLDESWRIVFNFVVVDKYNQVYPFEVSADTMNQWQKSLTDKLREAEWHFKTNQYSLPYEFATHKVIL